MDGQTLTIEFDNCPGGITWRNRSGFAGVRYFGLIPLNLLAREDGDGDGIGTRTTWILPDSTILHREIVA